MDGKIKVVGELTRGNHTKFFSRRHDDAMSAKKGFILTDDEEGSKPTPQNIDRADEAKKLEDQHQQALHQEVPKRHGRTVK